MMNIEGLTNPELQRVLWACLAYWNSEPLPPDDRIVCYSWVARYYQNRFGATFHPSKLQDLSQLGLLTKGDTSRGGNRRYYRVNNATRCSELLEGCNLS